MSVEPSKLVPPEAKRPTFNLQMLHDGHAVSLVIFPNVPMAGIASGSAKAPLQGDFKRGKKQELSHLAARSSRWRVCVIQFETSFENKKSAVETVTPMMDKDGKWRVSCYFIK